jgi:antitoxin Phd
MMAAVYNYSKARQNLAAVLEQAAKEGEVRIKRKDGQVFVIKPESGKDSPLDIEGVSLNISTDEVVAIIREGREERTYTQ